MDQSATQKARYERPVSDGFQSFRHLDRRTTKGRRLPIRTWFGNGNFQYIQDKQEVTLNGQFGVQIGPSSDFADIQAGMSEIRTKSDHPQIPLDVLVAA